MAKVEQDSTACTGVLPSIAPEVILWELQLGSEEQVYKHGDLVHCGLSCFHLLMWPLPHTCSRTLGP